MRLEIAAEVANVLGEGPIWSAAEGRLYWLDIKKSRLHAMGKNGRLQAWQLGSATGCMAICDSGELLLASVEGLVKFSPDTREETLLYPMNYGPEGVRPNDGHVDPRGRFWFGTMWDGNAEGYTGKIFRFDGRATPAEQMTGFHIPNTVAWSPDYKTMYLGDSIKSTIWAYEYDIETGVAGARRVFARVEEDNIVPDGSAIDRDGFLWNAQWGGARVVRYAPNGEVDRVISIPTDQVTSCAFGGEDLDILYITTASTELSDQQRIAQPSAGHLFALYDTGVCGIPDAKILLG